MEDFQRTARAEAGIKGLADAIHVVEGLGLEGGRDGDDAAANMGIAIKQPGEKMGLEFVLAGLSGEDDNKGETEMIDDGILDGTGDLNDCARFFL